MYFLVKEIDMRYVILGMMVLVLTVACGCENKELLQCQDENKSLLAEVEKAEKLKEERMVLEEMLTEFSAEFKKQADETEMKVAAAREEGRAELAPKLEKQGDKLKRTNQAMLKTIARVKKLEEEKAAAQNDLAKTAEMMQELGEVNANLTAENEALQAENAKLKEKVE